MPSEYQTRGPLDKSAPRALSDLFGMPRIKNTLSTLLPLRLVKWRNVTADYVSKRKSCDWFTPGYILRQLEKTEEGGDPDSIQPPTTEEEEWSTVAGRSRLTRSAWNRLARQLRLESCSVKSLYLCEVAGNPFTLTCKPIILNHIWEWWLIQVLQWILLHRELQPTPLLASRYRGGH